MHARPSAQSPAGTGSNAALGSTLGPRFWRVPHPCRVGRQGRPLPTALRPRVAGRRSAPGRASSADAGDRLPGAGPPGAEAGAGLHPGAGGAGVSGRKARGCDGGVRAAGDRGPRAGRAARRGLSGLKRGPRAAPHRAAHPRARCGRRAIHTPSGHSARRGGGGRRFNGDFAGRRRGRGRGPAAGAARCYAVAAGPAARARRPHYAGNAV